MDIHPSLSIDRSAASGGVGVPCIGVFDSGVGGLTVLRALRARLPGASLLYVGDAAWAPYGERSPEQILERCRRIAEYLLRRGARLLVVACNTATAVALETLRTASPEVPIVGVEPGIRPAVTLTRRGRIAVLTTPATAVSSRLHRLIEAQAVGLHVHVQACPGLAAAIERGHLDRHALRPWLRPACASVNAMNVDTVVLGCTHYPFITRALRHELTPGITLVDTAPAIAERAACLWPADRDCGQSVQTEVLSTGARSTMQTLLGQCPGLEQVRVESLAL